MILSKNFDDLKKSSFVDLKCDYCGTNFNRKKFDILRGKKIIDKDSCSNKSCISLKRQESNIKKYGVSNPTKNKHVKEKQIETLIKNYGVTTPSKSSLIKQKIAETNISRYGNKCSLHGKEVKKKVVETCRKKYGCDHPFSSIEIRKKIKETMYEKYGDYYTKTDDYLNKTKETCIKKYGKNHFSQNIEIQSKKKKTNLKKYGCEFASQHQDIKEKIFKLGNQRKNYGKTQNEIKNHLTEVSGLEFNSIMIDGKEIDIYNDQINLGIEYCGLRWHNENSPEPRTKYYHWNKYKECLDRNIRLITIFEDEWVLNKVKCKNYLNSILGLYESRIFARKCSLLEVDNKVSNSFYEKYHLFGKPYNTKKSFALFFNREIIGIMSLGIHHRCSSKIIINRLCFKHGIQVIGGASKLFNACLNWCKENRINEIVTWSDNRWSTGSLYQKIGFILERDLKPDYSYVDLKKKFKRLTKQSQKKSNSGCPKSTKELDWAKMNNLARIWDCGKKRWLYKVDNQQ